MPINQTQKKFFGGSALNDNDKKMLQLLETRVFTMLNDSL